MKAFNRTHLYFEQVSDDQDGAIIDSFYIVKDSHGPYKTDNTADWSDISKTRPIGWSILMIFLWIMYTQRLMLEQISRFAN